MVRTYPTVNLSDVTGNAAPAGTVDGLLNQDPNSGLKADNSRPQGPVARIWQEGTSNTTKWIIAAVILAILAAAIWWVIKKMK